VATGPSSVAVGDFNGDGKLDLAVTTEAGSPAPPLPADTVSVLLGNGDGTFQAAPNSPVGTVGPSSVAVGDFNGDGVPDVAVASAAPTLSGTGTGSGTVSVLLGNGDGSFRASLNVAVGMDPRFVAVGDFNGDGVPDLAVAEDGGYTCSQVS